MTSITPDELRERLREVLARIRNGEQFVIVDDQTAVAGLLPVADLSASVSRERRVGAPEAADAGDERPAPPARRATSDETDLERLREELENRRE